MSSSLPSWASKCLNRLVPATIACGRADDPRMGTLFTDNFDEARVVLIGFPHDEGCTRNGGRPGASKGPAAFRRFVTALGPAQNPEHGIDLSRIKVYDAGDVVATAQQQEEDEVVGRDASSSTLEQSHLALEEMVLHVLNAGKFPFVIGGGNDQSAANGRAALSFLAVSSATATGATKIVPPLGVINIDAHLDVRPKIDGKVHSGTPFRELLEDPRTKATCGGRHFVEFACQGQQCSQEHADFVSSHGGSLMWLTKLGHSRLESFKAAMQIAGQHCFVSFDIDAVQSSDCPGVSCPGSVGLTAQDALDIARYAGRNPATLLMDVSELNPVVEDYRSPRLAVMMFYHLLLGLSERQQNKEGSSLP